MCQVPRDIQGLGTADVLRLDDVVPADDAAGRGRGLDLPLAKLAPSRLAFPCDPPAHEAAGGYGSRLPAPAGGGALANVASLAGSNLPPIEIIVNQIIVVCRIIRIFAARKSAELYLKYL